jgi:MoaA/NifB/PqqE/SkfB family radical SAM enzyme
MIVLWRITERCNYACGFCAYDRRLSGLRREASPTEALRFGRLLTEFGQKTERPVLLSWLGGEPLLWPHIFPTSRALRSDGLAISATTNASTLHREPVRHAILENFAELTVSVDADEAQHDLLRGMRGAWMRARDGITCLDQERRRSGSPLKLRANVVLMRSTLPHFSELCDDLADWGIDEITFNQLGGRDRPEFYPAERLRPEDVGMFKDHVAGLQDRLSKRDVRLCADDRYLDRFGASAANAPLTASDCGLGEDFLFIDERGTIAPCSFSTGDYGVPISEIRTVADLAALPGRFAGRHAKERCATCADCPSTQVFGKFAP